MIGFNNLSDNLNQTSTFYTNGSWQTWQKPIGARNVYIFCLGGGSGGQAGAGGSAGVTRAGGTGGAAAGYSYGTFSANTLPDYLYVNVGAGGPGGAGGGGAGANSTAGSLSYVSVLPNTTTQNVLMASGNVAAAATNGLTNIPAGGTVWTFTSGYVLPFLGLIAYNAGINGTPAGTGGGAGASVAVTSIITGGAAGGGCVTSTPNIGGNITSSGAFLGIAGGTANGADGGGGLSNFRISGKDFLFFTGGAGGGAINSGTGGAGGNASFGCGGGGGGAGTTGGRGGKGGDGIVIIVSW